MEVLGFGVLALGSLVERGCMVVLLLLFHACAPAWPQLFLCIIDGKVRIAEVMRWEGAAKRQGGQARAEREIACVGQQTLADEGQGIWSNRSWHWAGGTCHHAVCRACRFLLSNTACHSVYSDLAGNKLECRCNKRDGNSGCFVMVSMEWFFF